MAVVFFADLVKKQGLSVLNAFMVYHYEESKDGSGNLHSQIGVVLDDKPINGNGLLEIKKELTRAIKAFSSEFSKRKNKQPDDRVLH
ncbi:hypothetical protein J3998_07860 [Thiomicrorhabdus sp. 6S2-11]|uniref:Uncharacterized protein n=1 Tax=Thiomicrorhabdus marina TaxID=2818442 RepID=A0ABS3Q563_9GAMM|nr:hypothetical protein [Thiomicrorhabdus marina]MBO1927491.1 hypothetical protein [Thiomicrorhabdus marina]